MTKPIMNTDIPISVFKLIGRAGHMATGHLHEDKPNT